MGILFCLTDKPTLQRFDYGSQSKITNGNTLELMVVQLLHITRFDGDDMNIHIPITLRVYGGRELSLKGQAQEMLCLY